MGVHDGVFCGLHARDFMQVSGFYNLYNLILMGIKGGFEGAPTEGLITP